MTSNIHQDRDHKMGQKQPLEQNKAEKAKAPGDKNRDASWSGGAGAHKTDRR